MTGTIRKIVEVERKIVSQQECQSDRQEILAKAKALMRVHDPIANLFCIPRHNMLSAHRRERQAAAMQMWRDIVRLQAA